jgi:hypothetical protein
MAPPPPTYQEATGDKPPTAVIRYSIILTCQQCSYQWMLVQKHSHISASDLAPGIKVPNITLKPGEMVCPSCNRERLAKSVIGTQD